MNAASTNGQNLLKIRSIDDQRLEISAHGRLDASCQPILSDRLAQLLACQPATLRIDLSAVTVIDPEIVAILDRAGSILGDTGGRLELVGAAPDLAAALAVGTPG